MGMLLPFGLFTQIWYILWSFGIFCGHLVYFFPLLVCCTKIWQSCLQTFPSLVEHEFNVDFFGPSLMLPAFVLRAKRGPSAEASFANFALKTEPFQYK
jgi:hypothetical protein